MILVCLDSLIADLWLNSKPQKLVYGRDLKKFGDINFTSEFCKLNLLGNSRISLEDQRDAYYAD